MQLREADARDAPFLERILLEAYNWSQERVTPDWVRTNETARRYLEGFPAARRRGVGSRLMTAIVAVARQRRIPGLSLSVEDGNTARALYERAGFEVVGRTGGSDTMLLRTGAD